MRKIVAKLRTGVKSLGRKPAMARDAKGRAIRPGTVVMKEDETATALHTTKLGRLSLVDQFGHCRFWWPDQVAVVK